MVDKPVRGQGSSHGPFHRILVGTHNKSCTVWMMNIFKVICVEYSLIYYSYKPINKPLNRCETLDEKFLFEMEYADRLTVNEMLA